MAERMAEAASPRRSDAQPLANGASLTEEESSAFECNICYEIAQSPVVTLCGHLYCWPCLYRYARDAAVPSFCASAVRAGSAGRAALLRFCLTLPQRVRAGGCRCRATAACVLYVRPASSRTRHGPQCGLKVVASLIQLASPCDCQDAGLVACR